MPLPLHGDADAIVRSRLMGPRQGSESTLDQKFWTFGSRQSVEKAVNSILATAVSTSGVLFQETEYGRRRVPLLFMVSVTQIYCSISGRPLP